MTCIKLKNKKFHANHVSFLLISSKAQDKWKLHKSYSMFSIQIKKIMSQVPHPQLVFRNQVWGKRLTFSL